LAGEEGAGEARLPQHDLDELADGLGMVLNFSGELGHTKKGLSIPFPLYFFEVSKKSKLFGWQTIRLAFEKPWISFEGPGYRITSGMTTQGKGLNKRCSILFSY
jgi:hypothetical protein